MKLSVNVVIQLMLTLVQAINAVLDVLPPRGRFYAVVTISALQGVVAVLSHFANPDGTPAVEPWRKQ